MVQAAHVAPYPFRDLLGPILDLMVGIHEVAAVYEYEDPDA